VHNHGAAKTQESELDTAHIEQPRVSLVNDVQVVNLVFARTQLFQDLNVLASSPYCVDWNVQRVCLVEELGQLGERETFSSKALFDRGLRRRGLNGALDVVGEEWRVLGDVLEGPGFVSIITCN
jgi:hypothetical protein